MAEQLKVQPIQQKTIRFVIRGTSPLIQHAWNEKGLGMMRMTAQERRKQPKTARDPEAEAQAAMYVTEDGSPGLPILSLKAALISAAHKDLGIEKTLVRKSLFFPSSDSNMCVPLNASEPIVREDIVRVGQNQTDLRYRPQFDQWSAEIECVVDANALTTQDVINLVNRAGFGIGLNEWRPEKGGEYGRFELDTTQEVQEIL